MVDELVLWGKSQVMEEQRLQALRVAISRNWALGMLTGVAQTEEFEGITVGGFGVVTRADLEELAKGNSEVDA